MQLEITETALAQAATPSVFPLPDRTKVDTDETETACMVVDKVGETHGVPRQKWNVVGLEYQTELMTLQAL